MRFRIAVLLLSAGPWLCAPPLRAGLRTESAWQEQVFPVLQRYCVDCHDRETHKGNVDFESLAGLPEARNALRIWWRAHDQITSGQMPPRRKPQPTEEERSLLLAWIADNENYLRAMPPADPGERRLRRLSRTEYGYALRDLLGTDPSAVEDFFPEEGAGGEGFDNTGDVLFIPPAMMEEYLDAADHALTAAVGNPEWMAPLGENPAGDREAVRAFLRPLVNRAFRKVVGDDVLEKIARIADQVLARGESRAHAVKTALKAVLCAPDFLLLRESDRTDFPVWPVSGYELATRLSLFLWSSIPDDELLAEAASGRLTDPAVLEAQTRRMLADPRALALAEQFCGQWLQFNRMLTSVDPDRRKYRFPREMKRLLYEEAVHFCDHILRGGGTFLDLLDSDYAFLNDALAAHYGLPAVGGREIRRVELGDSVRGGAIGLGAVLASTALPRRTSPVLRGKWVLETLLGSPPPPPPPNAGTLLPDDSQVENRTVRQQLEAHLRREDCRACHAKMDPIGFSLENFDPVGRWRTEVNGLPLDVTATFPDGTAISGPAGVRQWLLQERDRFGRNLAIKLLAWALGRGIEAADMPVIHRLEETMKANQFRAEPLILEIVRSLPFTHRRAPAAPRPGTSRTIH